MSTNTDNMIQTYQTTAVWHTIVYKTRTEYAWSMKPYWLSYVNSSGNYYAHYDNQYNVIWSGTDIAEGMNACYKHLAESNTAKKDKQATEHIFFEYNGSRYKISISYPSVDTLFYTVYVYAREGYIWKAENNIVRAHDVLDPWAIIEHVKACIDKDKDKG